MINQKKSLLSLAEALVKYGKKKGADEIEISIADISESSVEVRNGEIEQLVESGSQSIGMRVFLDHKMTSTASTDLREETLYAILDSAIGRVQFGNPDQYAGLPEFEAVPSTTEQLQLFDPAIAEIDIDTKIRLSLETESVALSDKRITNSFGAGFSSVVGKRILANSNGFSAQYDITHCGIGVYLQAGSDNDRVEEGWFESTRHFRKLPSPQQIAETAVNRTVRLLSPRKIASQVVPVIFEPKMTAMLLGFLYGCSNGQAIYRNQSVLTDRLGEKIANESVNIIDDGFIPAALGSKPFDGEGVPAARTYVIKNGVLTNYLLDTYSARRLQMRSTGNASGPNNFYLEKGEIAPSEIIASVDKGLLLTGTIGQGTNTVTGDLSKGAFGLWIEKGEVVYPVSEITINGNLLNMIQNISMIGSDLQFTRPITGPTIRIDGITIAGI